MTFLKPGLRGVPVKFLLMKKVMLSFLTTMKKKVLTSTSIIPVTFFEDFYFNSKEPGTFFWFFDKNHKEDGIGYIENGKIFISDIDEKIFCEYIKESDTKELKDD